MVHVCSLPLSGAAAAARVPMSNQCAGFHVRTIAWVILGPRKIFIRAVTATCLSRLG